MESMDMIAESSTFDVCLNSSPVRARSGPKRGSSITGFATKTFCLTS